MKGKLIVIDGTDGSGKATQTELLVERLKKEGFSVATFDFPRYGERSAVLVEDYLNGKYGTADEVGPYRASIFYAVDRYAASSEMKRLLSEGTIVISNRYVSSNMGHQAGKISDLKERDRFLKWLDELEFGIFRIPKPDATILLYVLPTIGQKLVDKKGHREYVGGVKRDIHEADINHLKNAAESYKYVANKFNWDIIECAPKGEMLSKKEIHSMVREKIKKLL
jgi:dTMP kinase